MAALRLGEHLVRAGVIDAAQLDAALRQQVVYGGRLGTNLIELGYARQDDVAQGLARLHGVPAALARHLSQHDNAVLELVPRSLAAQLAAFPIAYSMSSGRRLVVCLRDPNVSEAIAELSRRAQLAVVACAAPELAIYYWLERCYQIPRARRYAYVQPGQASPLPRSSSEQIPVVSATEDGNIEDESIDIDVDEPDMADMLQLVDLDHSQVARDHSQYHVDNKSQGSALDLVKRRDSDTSPHVRYTLREPTPAELTLTAAAAAATRSAVASASMKPPTPLPAVIPPRPQMPAAPNMTLAEAGDAIEAATTRDQVMAAVVAYMRGTFGAGLVLAVKDGLALGLCGFGGNFDEHTVETIVLPLSVPSFFSRAHNNRMTYAGEPDDGHLQTRFFRLFGGEPPDQVLVAPVVLRDRVVCMFYGHGRDQGAIHERHLAELQTLAQQTEQAFVRLIREAKKQPRT